MSEKISDYPASVLEPPPIQPEPAKRDVGTALAHERTDLATARSYMAAERTLMAWIRTALSMISFGFTIGKLGQALKEIGVTGPLGMTHQISIRSIAYFLVVLGTVALMGAAIQHWRRMREYWALGLPRRFSIALFVALALVLGGVSAFTALVLSL